MSRLKYPRWIEYCANWGCNLKCSHCCCGAFMFKSNDYIPLDQVQSELEPWANRVRPLHFYLVGGEPFIHPDFAELIKMCKKIWKTPLYVSTNGMTMESCPEEFMKVCRDTEAVLYVTIKKSFRPFENNYNVDKVQRGIQRWRDYGIQIMSPDRWQCYLWNFDSEGKPHPFYSDGSVAWRDCGSYTQCGSHIYDHKLYSCFRTAVWQAGIDRGTLNEEEWRLCYRPAEVTDSDDIILNTLTVPRPMADCSKCSPTYGYI